jgi:predicted nicotinamide N-methyase
MNPAETRAFVLANTQAITAPLVPELSLRLASEVVPLWQMTEAELEATGLPPPYWAFAWAGGQALARYILDHPQTVRGQSVLDFGAGSGLGAIAAAKAGAASVLAAEIDALARAAIALNADANGARVTITGEDVVGRSGLAQILLIGDMCYEQPLAGRIEAWLRAEAKAGRTILLGDPGRSYFPKSGVEKLASYAVKTTRDLEDTDIRNTGVYRLLEDGI